MIKKRLFYQIIIILATLLQSCSLMTMEREEKDIPDIHLKGKDVRVRILYTEDTLTIRPDGLVHITVKPDGPLFNLTDKDLYRIIRSDDSMILYKKDGEKVAEGKSILIQTYLGESSLTIMDVPFGIGWWWEGRETRNYSGQVSFYLNDRDAINAVVLLPLELYLTGVVPAEIGGDSPLEALKAQAVAARSEAWIALKSRIYRGDHYDLTSDVYCQVFTGNSKRTDATDQAVRETDGLILYAGDKPINAFYASNCGGHSENIENVWPERSGPAEWWTGQYDSDKQKTGGDLRDEKQFETWINSSPDVFCNPAFHSVLPGWSRTNFRWERVISAVELAGKFGDLWESDSVMSIHIPERGVSGRAVSAVFCGNKDSLTVYGELKIRQVFDPPLRSSAFYVEKSDMSEPSFTLKGAGWGHGVGMCQSGAIARAYQGQTFREILSHYYKGSEIKSIYELNDK